MADKQQILDAISQVLDQMGVSSGDSDAYDENGDMQDNTVPVWSKLQAGSMQTGNGPIHDKAALIAMSKPMSKPPMVTNYGMPVEDDQSEMMSALGMV